MSTKPSLVAIWMAEEVTRDNRTGRLIVRGAFNQVQIPVGATGCAEPMTVFFSVTDVRAECNCRLTLVDLDTLDVVVNRPVRLDPTPDPFEVTDVTVRVNGIPDIHPGDYAWELHASHERLGATRLRIETHPTPEGE